MSAPPVVDHLKRNTIQDIKSKSIFSIFNIVAVVAILVIGYFLYKKFNTKFKAGAIKIPSMIPTPVEARAAAPVDDEVPESPKED